MSGRFPLGLVVHWFIQVCQKKKLLDGVGEQKIATGELEDKLAAGKREHTGSDPAVAEASDIHTDSYLSQRPN